MMKKLFVSILLLTGIYRESFTQIADTISEKEVGRVVRFLASDSLKGRGNGMPELLVAARFIANEFRKNKLQPLSGFPGYFISFRPFGGSKNAVADNLFWNGQPVSSSRFYYLSATPGDYGSKSLSDFLVKKLDSCFSRDILEKNMPTTSPLLLWTDKMQPGGDDFLPEKINIPPGEIKHDLLLVYAETAPGSLTLFANPQWYSMAEYNVVGVLPGKSKPNEAIMFSSHYDHLGVYGSRRDSILNGANDNASGTAAVIALAGYFSQKNDNERTLIFCAFAGEELGLLGSYDLANILNPDQIVAGINIEMIGLRGFGKNRVMITGELYSDLPDMLRKAFKSNGMSMRSEPDPGRQLFLRSDNYPFVLKGVPFHTIMASDDNEPCYHQPCDELNRLDIPNMTRIIRAIARSVKGLVSGEFTPWRINPNRVEKPD